MKRWKNLDSIIGFFTLFGLLVVLTKNNQLIYRFKRICNKEEQQKKGSIRECQEEMWYDKFDAVDGYS